MPEIYDSIADLGEFWVTALVYYLAGPIPAILGFKGVKQGRDRTNINENLFNNKFFALVYVQGRRSACGAPSGLFPFC
jgi:hypothetical protein